MNLRASWRRLIASMSLASFRRCREFGKILLITQFLSLLDMSSDTWFRLLLVALSFVADASRINSVNHLTGKHYFIVVAFIWPLRWATQPPARRGGCHALHAHSVDCAYIPHRLNMCTYGMKLPTTQPCEFFLTHRHYPSLLCQSSRQHYRLSRQRSHLHVLVTGSVTQPPIPCSILLGLAAGGDFLVHILRHLINSSDCH